MKSGRDEVRSVPMRNGNAEMIGGLRAMIESS
ncbi:protein of unknown function [Kyrpidia spormannii]|uniref:Uncharacterized protein n=2 Tax=Kyrpidia spormannii TaxID=2055160 RepID=A0ACA8ZEZ7_9BACL|nr:protein of unknown function [Kyrpidia spormannii]CAB3395558.1 protein of unknown function [Kyrpidia spormannii]